MVTHPDASRTTFTYNAEGKRLSKQDISGLVEYTYDMDKVILERDGQAQTVAAYTHEGGSLYHDLISMHRSDGYYHLFDGLGSVSEVTDSAEAVQNRYRYEAFGQFKLADEAVPNPYTYVGAYGVQWDAGTGLHFMQARYYAGTIGRFISMDPFRGLSQDPMSLHRYLYTANSPVNRVDPTGYAPGWDKLLALLAVASALAFLLGAFDCIVAIGRAATEARRARAEADCDESADTRERIRRVFAGDAWQKVVDTCPKWLIRSLSPVVPIP